MSEKAETSKFYLYPEDYAIIDSIANQFNGNRSLALRIILRRFRDHIQEHPEQLNTSLSDNDKIKIIEAIEE